MFVHKATGAPVKIGDIVKERTGQKWVVTGWNAPRTLNVNPESSLMPPLHAQSFYADVFNCEWIQK